MASPTQWTWVWVDSRSWWWTGRPGVLQFMGSQWVGHDWVTELNWRSQAFLHDTKGRGSYTRCIIPTFPPAFLCIAKQSKVKSLSRVRLFVTPWTCSPPGSSIHGILQARILEWVAMSFSRGSFQPRDRTWVSCITGRCFTVWTTREALLFAKIVCIWKREAKEAAPLSATVTDSCQKQHHCVLEGGKCFCLHTTSLLDNSFSQSWLWG